MESRFLRDDSGEGPARPSPSTRPIKRSMSPTGPADAAPPGAYASAAAAAALLAATPRGDNMASFSRDYPKSALARPRSTPRSAHVTLPTVTEPAAAAASRPQPPPVAPVPSVAASDATNTSTTSKASKTPGKRGSVLRMTGETANGEGDHTVVVTDRAAKLYMDMNQEALSSHEARTGMGVIHPLHKWYRAWWWTTVAAALVTGWLEPYRIAFANKSSASGVFVLTMILTGVFTVDIIVCFFRGYYTSAGELVLEQPQVAVHYARFQLWVDLMFTIPFDLIVLGATGIPYDSLTGRYITLLGLLQLGRMYRIFLLFRHLTYNLAVSLLVVTLVRNLIYTFYLVHWAGCGFFFIAEQTGDSVPATWVSDNADLLAPNGVPRSTFELYIYSFYWAIVTFDTLGYGDVSPVSLPEVIYVVLFIMINIVMWAYILGTITLLVTRSDEETGAYRARMQALREYCAANDLPPELKASMQALLKLYMSFTGEASDEHVLAPYPTTIRRRILRTLYGSQLSSCYLFKGTGQKFLDALLMGARVELFMPQVEVCASMDHINELYVIMGGRVELVVPQFLLKKGSTILVQDASAVPSMGGDMLASRMDNDAADGGVEPNRILGRADCFGEVAYFTEVPKLEAVRTLTVCRVLVIPRAVYTAVAADFPLNARQVLQNLQTRAEELVRTYVPDILAEQLLRTHRRSLPSSGGGADGRLGSTSADADLSRTRPLRATPGRPMLLSTLSMPYRSQRVAAAMEGVAAVAVPGDDEDNPHGLTPRQQRTIADLLRLRQLVRSAVAKFDQTQTEALLGAASRGDNDGVQYLLRQGMAPDTADHSGQTALMLASSKGHQDVVLALLFAGADANKADTQGRTALYAAVQAGASLLVDALRRHGGVLGMPPIMQAATLCKAVAEGRIDTLRLLLRAGADVNAADYDGQTALHVAVADGNLPAVKVLIDEGHANVMATDRWGATPLDMALKVGGAQEAMYLECHMPEAAVAKARQRHRQELCDDILNASYWGDADAVKQLLDRGVAADVSDYDGRTPLGVAAVNGKAQVVRVLLAAGANANLATHSGVTPLLEACKHGHDEVIEVLVGVGAHLGVAPVEESALVATVIHQNKWDLLKRLLRAGANPAAADYDSRTPLHVAAAQGDLEALEVMAEAEADPSNPRVVHIHWGVVDRWGHTPAHEAETHHHPAVAAFLREREGAPGTSARGGGWWGSRGTGTPAE